MHNYPVGAAGRKRKELTWVNKYSITPVRHELSIDVRAVVAVDFEEEMEERILHGLAGRRTSDGRRYYAGMDVSRL
ncbi:MAG: hypothetical protein ACRC1K_03005 [Planctomycetia bacterium]